jgi:hypothetical protein
MALLPWSLYVLTPSGPLRSTLGEDSLIKFNFYSGGVAIAFY